MDSCSNKMKSSVGSKLHKFDLYFEINKRSKQHEIIILESFDICQMPQKCVADYAQIKAKGKNNILILHPLLLHSADSVNPKSVEHRFSSE